MVSVFRSSFVRAAILTLRYRGVLPRLRQRLPISVPLPSRSPPIRLTSPQSHPRPAPRPQPPLVTIRHPKSVSVSPALRTRRELLERPHLGANELPCAQVIVHRTSLLNCIYGLAVAERLCVEICRRGRSLSRAREDDLYVVEEEHRR